MTLVPDSGSSDASGTHSDVTSPSIGSIGAGAAASATAPFTRAPDRYAVIGHPIAHSKSPLIQTAFAVATGQALKYVHLLAPLDGFDAVVRGFIAGGGRGMNVTVPFKLEAFALADVLTERASVAGAVNTLSFDEIDGVLRILGDNTDGAGLVQDIEHNIGCALAGKRILLLGAGGAARGVVQPLLARKPARLTISNRTLDRAHALQQQFAADAVRLNCILDVVGMGTLDEGASGSVAASAVQGDGLAYDVVINASASSLAGDLPTLPVGAINARTLAYDMMYSATHTVFMTHAAALGARVFDGLGMLVEQAAESFERWRGIRPDGATVLRALRAGTDPLEALLAAGSASSDGLKPSAVQPSVQPISPPATPHIQALPKAGTLPS